MIFHFKSTRSRFCLHPSLCNYLSKVIRNGYILLLILLFKLFLVSIGYICLAPRYASWKTQSKRVTHREAIISVLTGDAFLPAILVLAYTIKKYNANIGRDMLLFIPLDSTMDIRHVAMLETMGWTLIHIKKIPFPEKVYSRLADGLMKLYAWKLTQYEIISAIDADAMIIGSIEEPFEIMRKNLSIQILAVDHPSRPLGTEDFHAYFNAGVLFFRPNIHHYNELIRLSANTSYYDLEFPQQNLLNTYFQNQWTSLPIIFNMLDRLPRSHPLRLKNENDSRIIHYAGYRKPWHTVKKINKIKSDYDVIWHRYLVNLIQKNNWRKQDFLVSNASKDLRQIFMHENLAILI